MEGPPYPTLWFDVTLNDVKGGQMTATVYVDTGSGSYHPGGGENGGIAVYDPSVTTDEVWSDSVECAIDPPAGGGIKGKASIVFDYVYPDGETGRIEAGALPVHNGTYVRTNGAYGSGGYVFDAFTDEETGESVYTMSFEVILDHLLVSPDAVEVDYPELYLENAFAFYQDPEIETYSGAGGDGVVRFTFRSDTAFPEDNYYFSSYFWYREDDNNGWNIDDYYLNFHFYPPI